MENTTALVHMAGDLNGQNVMATADSIVLTNGNKKRASMLYSWFNTDMFVETLFRRA